MPATIEPGEEVLIAEDVRKSYGARTILRGVSLSIAAGEGVALMGPSGSGKSTLLNCLGGVDRPDSGSISIAGRRLESLTPDALATVRRDLAGTIFQFFHLLPTLTVRENIELPLQLVGLARTDRQARVDALVDEVGIGHRRDALPSQLSGGEMQRVAIARALAPQPRIIFADEPTGNLDSHTGGNILNLIEAVTREHTIALLLVTHSEEATRICGRTLRILDGELV